MARLLCDENFNGRLYAALTARFPDWVIDRVQDHGLTGEDGVGDPDILEWAAANGAVVLTHDRPMSAFAEDRLVVGLAMPGLIVVKGNTPFATVIDDIHLLVESGPDAWDTPIAFVPLR